MERENNMKQYEPGLRLGFPITLDRIDETGATIGQVIQFDGSKVIWGNGGGSGGSVWGSITGTLSNQTDLQNALNGKENNLTFNAPLIRTLDVISISQSGTSSGGYLSSIDWNTFNLKASGTGTPTEIRYFDNTGNDFSDSQATRDSVTHKTTIERDYVSSGDTFTTGLYTKDITLPGLPFTLEFSGSSSTDGNDVGAVGVFDLSPFGDDKITSGTIILYGDGSRSTQTINKNNFSVDTYDSSTNDTSNLIISPSQIGISSTIGGSNYGLFANNISTWYEVNNSSFYLPTQSFNAGYVMTDVNGNGIFTMEPLPTPTSLNLYKEKYSGGMNPVATGMDSVAIGIGTSAQGQNSIALGGFATVDAIGLNSIAIMGATVSGGISFGALSANVSGSGSVGFLNSAIVTGDNSFSFNTHVQGNGAIGLAGNSSVYVYGNQGVAIGNNIASYSWHETVFGIGNSLYTPVSSTTWDNLDRLFVIGSGLGDPGTPSERDGFMMLKNGASSFGATHFETNPLATSVRFYVGNDDGKGDVAFKNYPNTRDDSGSVPPQNFLYTDADGRIYSGTLSSISNKATENFGLVTGLTVTLASTPTFIYGVYKNGQYLTEGVADDYTISGTTITFNVALAADKIVVVYEYQ